MIDSPPPRRNCAPQNSSRDGPTDFAGPGSSTERKIQKNRLAASAEFLGAIRFVSRRGTNLAGERTAVEVGSFESAAFCTDREKFLAFCPDAKFQGEIR
jgi:hypothetical protein